MAKKKNKNLLFKIVTDYETGCFRYDRETKLQIAKWKAPNESKPKNISFWKVKSTDNVDLFLRFQKSYSQKNLFSVF